MLDKFMVDKDDEIKSLIKRRRLQMLIHSCIYYELNDNIWSDDKWQACADELQKLQAEYPHLCNIECWDEAFKDWDGATGTHLPLRHPWVYNKAKEILRNSRK